MEEEAEIGRTMVEELLPIEKYAKQIVHEIAAHQVTIVIGETGSGKSSKIPELLYKAGHNKIALTLPRRVSVLNIAKRIENNNP